ncbi:MAG: mannose-1-phosphate guanyltransferase [Candidatus Margulisiibacteriota bacterium]
MKAIILAGGLGTRLHPLTINIPKPMVPVANQPLMEYVIYLLRKYKFTDITALLYHQPEVIKNYFGDGSKFGVKLNYYEAKDDYGTAGSVRMAVKGEKEPILVISADLVTDFNLEAALKFHEQKKSSATMILTRVADPIQYGIVIVGKDGKIKHFLEKPSWSQVFSDTVNCGMYILDPSILDYIPENKYFDFSQDLFPLILSKAEPIYGYIAEGVWKDIGSLVEYGKVHLELFKDTKNLISDSAKISKTAVLEGINIIGDGAVIGDKAILKGTSIGKNCEIGKGTYIEGSVLWDKVIVGKDARIEKAIIAKKSVIEDRCLIEGGVVIGEETHIEKDVNVKPFVKIWPNKVIEEGAVVSRSVVWRERWSKGIFGPFGVTGLCNVEMTPEFAASLGAAYGTVIGKGNYISTSRDSHKSSRMIYRALLSGVLSAGVNVSDLEMVPIPVNRFELKVLKSSGGLHVRKSPYDNDVIDIKFFGNDGMDLASYKEKKIERLFFGEDYKRADINSVGELSFPFHRVAESYKEAVISSIDKTAVSSSRFKVVVDYAYSSASQIFPSILGELGIEVIALNAHIDETKITKTREEFEKNLSQLSQIVKTLKADLGIMLDTGAEKIFLCNQNGQVLLGDHELAAMASLHCRLNKNAIIAVSAKASRVIDQIAKKYKAKVIRTKTGAKEMMEASDMPNIDFLGETAGGFIFPKFQPAFDAMFASVKLLEMLSKGRLNLAECESEIPEIFMVGKEISCGLDMKGKILRTLIDEVGNNKIDLTDGVKIFHADDWVLVLPDPMRPIVHIYSEAGNKKDAQKLIKEYIEKIDSIT